MSYLAHCRKNNLLNYLSNLLNYVYPIRIFQIACLRRLPFVPSEVGELDRITLRKDVFVSNSIKVTYSPEEDGGLPDEEGDVSSEARYRPRLLAATVTGLCVLAAAFLGGAFKE